MNRKKPKRKISLDDVYCLNNACFNTEIYIPYKANLVL